MSDLYERIKSRRIETGLSQQELADTMGYRSRSTIAKIESGENDIPQSKIKAFAEALNTTPAFLMGWEEEKDKPAPSNEDELIAALRSDPIKMELAQIIMNLDHEGLEKLQAVVDLVKNGLQ